MAPRVGLVTTSFPRFEGDAAGSFVFGMARALSRRGIDVEAVVPESRDDADWEEGAPWLSKVRVIAVPYARPRTLERLFFESGVPDNLTRRPLTAALIPSALVQLTRTTAKRIGSWDAAVSHWPVPSSFVVASAARLVRNGRPLPHLAIAHSGDIHLLSSPILRPLARLVPKTASALGFVSRGLRDKYLRLLPDEAARSVLPMTHITPMGIDFAELETTRSREAIREALDLMDFTVLFLGRLVPIKGVEVLLEAMRGLKGFELIVAGDGPLRYALEKQASQLKIRARFVGSVKSTERAALLKACDALVLPSFTLENNRTEGLPLVLSEAMAARLPVIASDTGSVTELAIHERTGLVFPERDGRALARALSRLRDDSSFSRRLADAAFNEVKKRDWNLLIDAMLPLVGLAEPSRSAL